MSRFNLADDMLARMADGRAHDDAIAMLTATVEQVRNIARGTPWERQLFEAQADILTNDGGEGPEALARLGAAILDLASITATAILALTDGLGYDADAFIAALGSVRPPFLDA